MHILVSTFILPNQVDRWLARQCKQPEPGSPASHPHQPPASCMRPTAPAWGAGASGRDGDLSIEEEERLLGRIKDAWFQVDVSNTDHWIIDCSWVRNFDMLDPGILICSTPWLCWGHFWCPIVEVAEHTPK